MLTQEELRKLVEYDPVTGVFTRLNPPKEYCRFGWVENTGYLRVSMLGVTYQAHRLAFLYMEGYIPEQVDHKDRRKLNNRWENLRACNTMQNCQNRKRSATNQSGVTGVYKSGSGWRVRISVNKKQKSFGSYDNLELASLVAEEARSKYHGEFKHP